VRSHGLSRDREPEAETRTIDAASLAERLEQVPLTLWYASAFVLNVYQQAVPFFVSGLGMA
jgi:hypothetical protein